MSSRYYTGPLSNRRDSIHAPNMYIFELTLIYSDPENHGFHPDQLSSSPRKDKA